MKTILRYLRPYIPRMSLGLAIKIGGTMASGAAFDRICELILNFPNEEEKAEFIKNVQTAVNKDYYVG